MLYGLRAILFAFEDGYVALRRKENTVQQAVEHNFNVGQYIQRVG
jgi:hypothetical protein